MRVCFVDTPNSQIELIEPLGEDSPITKFLEKNPLGGQHHVCFEVPDIHEAISAAQSVIAIPVGERAARGGTPSQRRRRRFGRGADSVQVAMHLGVAKRILEHVTVGDGAKHRLFDHRGVGRSRGEKTGRGRHETGSDRCGCNTSVRYRTTGSASRQARLALSRSQQITCTTALRSSSIRS